MKLVRAQMLLGYPNSLLLLHNLAHRNLAEPDAPEVRKLACELVMCTSALIEMAQTIFSTLATIKATLEKNQARIDGEVRSSVKWPPTCPTSGVRQEVEDQLIRYTSPPQAGFFTTAAAWSAQIHTTSRIIGWSLHWVWSG